MVKYLKLAVAVAVPLALGACNDSTGPDNGARMRVAFATSSSAAVNANDEMVVTGTNGTLRITDVRMIVSQLELKGPDACMQSDDAGEQDMEECEFEAKPFLLDLPLSGSEVVVATTDVPQGTYTKLKFEVEDLDEDSEDDSSSAQALAQITTQLRAAYPNFPHDASVVVKGTYTATGSTVATPFIVYLDTDGEFEQTLNPPLVITDTGANRTLTVQIDPSRWFVNGTGVLDLSLLNGRLLKLEDEFRGSVKGVHEDDH